jgi:predicted lipid-binding transport protein (Tim44 family)
MKYSSINRGIPAGNPIANALVVVAGALAIDASIVLGFFAFVVLGSIVLVLGAIIGLRVWWFNRKLRNQPGMQQRPDQAQPGGVIEGEYHVVKGDEKP